MSNFLCNLQFCFHIIWTRKVCLFPTSSCKIYPDDLSSPLSEASVRPSNLLIPDAKQLGQKCLRGLGDDTQWRASCCISLDRRWSLHPVIHSLEMRAVTEQLLVREIRRQMTHESVFYQCTNHKWTQYQWWIQIVYDKKPTEKLF